MMKVLGSINLDFQGFSLKLGDADYKFLQEILIALIIMQFILFMMMMMWVAESLFATI